jgi:enterochelin esterase-like enzyme
MASSLTADPVPYRIYLPPCYGTTAARYPTLFLLHGNIHDESFWDALGVDEAAETAIADGTLPPLIIVMPNGGSLANDTSGGPGSFEALVVEELIPHVDATYCTWAAPAGRAIGGISRGGYWSLEIAFRHAALFAGVGGHSAALLDIGAGPDLDPVYTGVANPLGDLRIYLDVGSEDWVLNSVAPLHEALAAAAIPHTWLLQPGGHDETYWSAHVADYLAWYGETWRAAPAGLPACAGG